ncbi:MAG: hypothetical protein IKX91_02825 [Firmicutes bacterium]|nr:hypothetical protein [Bacillota bacterium]
MNRKTTRVLVIVLCLVLAMTLFTGCGRNYASEAKKLNRGSYGLRIAGGPEGSEEAALANALATILKNGGYGATVLTTEGAEDNVDRTRTYKADLAIVSSNALKDAGDGLYMLMALGTASDGSRNVILCSDDTMPQMAWDMLSLIASSLDALEAASDGSEITMAEGNTDLPVTLNEGAAAYFKKQPWKK